MLQRYQSRFACVRIELLALSDFQFDASFALSISQSPPRTTRAGPVPPWSGLHVGSIRYAEGENFVQAPFTDVVAKTDDPTCTRPRPVCLMKVSSTRPQTVRANSTASKLRLLGAPGVFLASGSEPCGVFPLGLRRKSRASPRGIRHGIVPGDHHDRKSGAGLLALRTERVSPRRTRSRVRTAHRTVGNFGTLGLGPISSRLNELLELPVGDFRRIKQECIQPHPMHGCI